MGGTHSGRRGAFTLIELLVVVAIIALLLSITLPTLSKSREEGKKARCLANLRSIGMSLLQYAMADEHGQVIPISASMRTARPYWEWRTVIWFAWGGRSGQEPFRLDPQTALVLGSAGDGGELRPQYDARNRPLNRQLYADLYASDAEQMDLFRCPSDQGYPEHPDIDDSPLANAGRPCYATLGNSYRASLSMLTLGELGGVSRGHFSTGPWGHRYSTLRAPARLALVGEPTFFNMIGRDDLPEPDPVLVTGWHKKYMLDNLLFCDGSARPTLAEGRVEFDEQAVQQMKLYHGRLLWRGRSWQLDDYPNAGARIWGDIDDWRGAYPGFDEKWPFAGYQDNLRDP